MAAGRRRGRRSRGRHTTSDCLAQGIGAEKGNRAMLHRVRRSADGGHPDAARMVARLAEQVEAGITARIRTGGAGNHPRHPPVAITVS
jgi:hypothetical protein